MPNFWQGILNLVKTIKNWSHNFIFLIKQEDIYDYNLLCFMSIGLMLCDILWIYSQISQNKTKSAKNDLFSKIKNDKIYLYEGSLQDYQWKKWIYDTKKTLRTHHFIEKEKWWRYICGLFSIVIDETDLENRTNQLINDISNFNNEHRTQCYSKTWTNIPEERRYKPSMTPPGFINGQD